MAARWMLSFVLASCLTASACGRGAPAALTQIQSVKNGPLEIVLLSDHEAIRHGKDSFVIEFRSSTNGNLTDVGSARASASMPMSGAPMFGSIEVKRTDVPGRYAATGDFSMAGTWRMKVEWDGSDAPGSVSFPGTVH
jgi:hypothetical protein